MSLPISDTISVLQQHITDPKLLAAVIKDLNRVDAEKEAAKPEPAPKGKNQYVGIIADADGKLKRAGLDTITGWVVQIPESESPALALPKVMQAAHDFNASKKGRLLPVKSVGEAFESASRKFFKNAGVNPKHKMPIYFLVTDNKLTEAPSA